MPSGCAFGTTTGMVMCAFFLFRVWGSPLSTQVSFRLDLECCLPGVWHGFWIGPFSVCVCVAGIIVSVGVWHTQVAAVATGVYFLRCM